MSTEEQVPRWADVAVTVVVWVAVAALFVPLMVAFTVADWRDARSDRRDDRDAEEMQRWRRGKRWRDEPRLRAGFRVPGGVTRRG